MRSSHKSRAPSPKLRRSPADAPRRFGDKDYQVPFPFNGTINKLTFKLGPMQVAEEEDENLRATIARAKD